MTHTPSDGIRPRQSDGTFDLACEEPRAVVRTRIVADNPNPGGPRCRWTIFLPAANQPSSVLEPMLADRGYHNVEIVDIALVCEACHYPADGLVHTSC